MPFRFVHAADIHLDSPLRTLALREAALAELVGGATRRAFVAIVDLCLAERVDALLIAGDLYDGDQTSMKTARFLADQLRRLHEAGISSYVIRGNHDAESRITRELVLPDSVKVFGGRADVVLHAAGALDVAIHGISFAQKHAPESLLTKFREPRPGAVNIGLLHTSLGGSAAHDRYAPCAPADLHGSGFAYWALGHVHQRSVEQGRATIVMPGNPQGRDINEAGPKSATLVTIDDGGAIAVEERPTAIAEFRRVAVDLAGAGDWRAAVGRIERALEAARAATSSEHLVARLILEGATPLAWRLRSDADLIEEEARRIGADLGGAWLDTIEIRCREPLAGAGGGADPVAELRLLMETEVAGSKAFRDELQSIAEDLRGHLPPGAREDLFGADAEGFAEALGVIAREGADDVLAFLRAADREA
ncbi:DNA repair exonuclease SbcCD nuclease subunit [Roseiarcus fermentans]|uniref:DNA repair exonuclease SbcCD nuclease subunit n=1 Tax=Roseiarcus fermentans TaxID=1473586 RepID=A0A366EQA4_9HYPH|nr:DNA repair exonuclease [Roseiarcus fermentans]RBP04551.1 DNA repair exonuclease SbcCD nuclease subunit [Roseiarcus fermentans]